MGASNTSVLISGAGIAGPALAYWLKRYGSDPTVVEQAPKSPERKAMLTLAEIADEQGWRR